MSFIPPLHLHALIHLTCHGAYDRCSAIFLQTRSHRLPNHWLYSLNFHLPPLSLFLSLSTSRRNALFGSLWAFFFTTSDFLLERGSSRNSAQSKNLAQSVAAECMLVGWLMVCDQWCHRCMLCPCPTCSAQKRGGVLGYGVNPFDSLIWGFPLPAVPLNQTSLSCPDEHDCSGTCLRGGRFLQFNCNVIQHCRTSFIITMVLVACLQETKLSVNSFLKTFIDYATIRRNCPVGGGALWWTCHFRVSSTIPSNTGCLIVTYSPTMPWRKSWRLRQTSAETPLTFVDVYISYHALLENRQDQMVLGDFDVHHPSWYSRTGNDSAAARGEALDTSQLAVVNLDLLTCLPSQGQISSPNVILLSGHLLPNATWFSLTTLGSDPSL